MKWLWQCVKLQIGNLHSFSKPCWSITSKHAIAKIKAQLTFIGGIKRGICLNEQQCIQIGFFFYPFCFFVEVFFTLLQLLKNSSTLHLSAPSHTLDWRTPNKASMRCICIEVILYRNDRISLLMSNMLNQTVTSLRLSVGSSGEVL